MKTLQLSDEAYEALKTFIIDPFDDSPEKVIVRLMDIVHKARKRWSPFDPPKEAPKAQAKTSTTTPSTASNSTSSTTSSTASSSTPNSASSSTSSSTPSSASSSTPSKTSDTTPAGTRVREQSPNEEAVLL